MKAAIALLIEGEAYVAVRRVALELHEQYGCGLSAAQLPVHVSLKQPFQISSLPEIEAFFDGFVASLEPINLTLSTLEFFNVDAVMTVYLGVLEDAILRPIHKRLNTELENQFGNTQAPFDGETYHFHATAAIEYENTKTLEAQKLRAGERFDISTTAISLGLFIYTRDDSALPAYVCYKISEIKKD